VSCVVGKREGEEAEVAFSVDRGWNGAREAAWWGRPWTTSVTGERIDYARKVGLSLHHRRPGFGSVSLALPYQRMGIVEMLIFFLPHSRETYSILKCFLLKKVYILKRR
jgi:hypothetical protein